MRYIDSGTRHPTQALGSWLENNLVADPAVQEIRWQSGFFSADSLGYFTASMKRLQATDGVLRVLIGSNDGTTSLGDAKALLSAAGPPRKNRRIGIVKFANAFFHPKTMHIVRGDGSVAAYVGSANLTAPGVTGVHIEAGLLLDTRDGDDDVVLDQIRDAIDRWFTGKPPGLSLVETQNDLDTLVKAGILPAQAIPAPSVFSAKSGSPGAATLKPLVHIPKAPTIAGSAPTPKTATAAAYVMEWTKELSVSDAQRKKGGNNRGSITLVKAGYPINAQTYFRNEFFKGAHWKPEKTNTGKKLETAEVPFDVDVLGKNLGLLHFPVSHAPNRESSQANYTSLLHVGPLADVFGQQDMTGKWLRLRRLTGGGFTLSILNQAP